MASPCPEQHQLAALLTGTVDREYQPHLESHVETCLNCQETLENVFANQTKALAPSDSILLSRPTIVPGWGKDLAWRLSRALAQNDARAELDEPSVALEQIGDYQILEKIGAGGMGAVYRAYHPKLDKTVAVKILVMGKISADRTVARFEREIRIVGKLDHPNIVRAMDAGEENGLHFLVMEYVDGIDLSRLSKQLGPLPISAACELIRQAALGLDEAHACGLIHRDIKPANLMLAKRNRRPPLLKILDMGLAQFSPELGRSEQEPQHDLTQTGQIMGTFDYIAPEQGIDSRNVDLRADIYSLGATLYRLLTGEVLFHGERYSGWMQKTTAIMTETPPSVRSKRKEIPTKLANIVCRMLEKNPEKRFSTSQEVAAALAPFADEADLQSLLDHASQEADEEPRSPPSIQGEVSVESESKMRPQFSALQDTCGVQDSAERSQIEGLQNRSSRKQQRFESAKQRPTRLRRRVASGPFFLARRTGVIAVLAMLGMLILSESTGLTNLCTYVTRIAVGEGTLVIECADPEITVSINGEIVTIGGAGIKKFRFRPGQYRLEAQKNDQPIALEKELVSITRGGKQVVRISLAPSQETVSSKPLPEIPAAVPATITATSGWVDVLPIVNLGFDMNADGATRDKNGIRFGHKSELWLPFEVKGNYQLKVKFTTTEKGPKYLTCSIPIIAQNPDLVLRMMDKERDYIGAGLANIDRRGPSNTRNPTRVKVDPIKVNQQQTLVMNISKNGDQIDIAATLDGKPFVHWIGKSARLSQHPWFSSTPNRPEQIRFRSYRGRLVVHSAEIQMRTGQARFVRTSPIMKQSTTRETHR